MCVVRRSLEVPRHLSRVGIERDERARVEVVALSALGREYRIRITCRHVQEVQLGIVGRRQPRHPSAMRHRVFVRPCLGAGVAHLLRRRIPSPLALTGFGLVRLEVALHVERVAADADDDVSADDDWRGRAEVLLSDVCDLFVPALLAGLSVERDEIAVWRFEEEIVAVQADAAVADVDAAAGSPEVMPDRPARACIDRIRVIRGGEIQHAVHHQRRRLDRHAGLRSTPVVRIAALILAARVLDLLGRGAMDPGERQRFHIRRVDLIEGTIPSPGIVAVVRGPRVGVLVSTRRIGSLGKQCDRQEDRGHPA